MSSITAGNPNLPFKAGPTLVASPGSAQYFDVVSLILPPGDYFLDALGSCVANGATWTRGTIGISSTSGDTGVGLVLGDNQINNIFASTSTLVTDFTLNINGYRVTPAVQTTYYMKGLLYFSAGTPNITGRLTARRFG